MKKWALVLLCGVLLAGCGTKFVYNNMDWLLIKYVEDYVELNDQQQELLGQKVLALSTWHRQEEIPNYIEHLDELLAIDPVSFTEQDLLYQEAKFQQHTQRVLQRIAPELFDLAKQLSDEQVKELMDNIRVRHTKYKKKYHQLTDEQTREVYAERISESLEKWLGSLTKEQSRLITMWTHNMQITSHDWINHQTKMRIELNTLLSNRFDLRYFQPHFETLLLDSSSYYSTELTKKIEHNRSVANHYLVQIVNGATRKQMKHYRQEIEDWKAIALDIQ